MRPNPAKAKLRQAEAVYGCMTLLLYPPAVEIMAAGGFELLVFDGEHGPLDRQLCEHLVRAAEIGGAVPIFRSALNHPDDILPYLDTGAMGVMVPHVTTAQKAAMIVEAVKYPPQGRRGSTPWRAGSYGVGRLRGSEYTEAANRETLIIAQIEDAAALDHLDDILAVDGIDVFDIGTGDLANSLGYPGQSAHPEVVKVIDRIVATASARDRVTSNPGADLPSMARYFHQGSRCFLFGDGRLLFRAVRRQVEDVQAILQAQEVGGWGPIGSSRP